MEAALREEKKEELGPALRAFGVGDVREDGA